MKVCNDDAEIKKRLKNYNPKRTGRRLPVNEQFKPEKLKYYLFKGLTESDLLARTYYLLKAVDEITDEMNVNKFAVCQSGCAYCCKIPVDVTLMEAELIAYETGKVINNPNPIKRISYKNSYCPFFDVDNAKCTIYSVRPLACRCFYSLEHYKYCKNVEVHHLITTVDSNSKWGEIESLLLTLSNNKVADIREWF
ncbi:YkgJ family cysteine cluster protein [Salmonella enterica subsp. arizonae]|nr:YkgJ family cysteine cluster protein [Salmonella enterica subsp. arizonae]